MGIFPVGIHTIFGLFSHWMYALTPFIVLIEPKAYWHLPYGQVLVQSINERAVSCFANLYRKDQAAFSFQIPHTSIQQMLCYLEMLQLPYFRLSA